MDQMVEQNVIEFVEIILAILGFVIAYSQYKKHIEQNRHAVLSEYNVRYCNDANIEKVVKYLIWFLENDNHEDPPKPPTVYEKEMFMRFFEELQLQVENGRLGEGTIEDFFAYYAVAATMCPEFVKDTDLLCKDCDVWTRYKYFVKSYPNLQKSISEDYLKHHPMEESIKVLI